MSEIVDEAKKIIDEERLRILQWKHMDNIFGRSANGPLCSHCNGEGTVSPSGKICPECHGTGRPY